MTKKTAVALAVAATSVSEPLSAEIEQDDHGVTLSNSASLTRVEVWSDRSIRVTHRPPTSAPPSASLSVIGTPEKVDWKLADGETHILLTTPKLQVRVEKATGSVRFLDENGVIILSEAPNGTSLKPASMGSAKETLAVQQSFETDSTEALYGFGQGQDGVMNYQGQVARVQQRNAFIGVPVMVSSRGYGILWDNPAVTEVNVNAGRPEFIPAARLLDDEGKPGGLTAQYFEEENFDKPVAARTEGPVDFQWFKVPPQGITKDSFRVRWSGFVEAEKAGKYAVALSSWGRVKLWLDDRLVIDDTNTFHPITLTAMADFAARSRHRIRLDFQSKIDRNEVHLAWRLPVETPAVTWSSEAGDAVNYFFLRGPEIDQVIASYRALTGAAPMFGKWAWGLWQSRAEPHQGRRAPRGLLDREQWRGSLRFGPRNTCANRRTPAGTERVASGVDVRRAGHGSADGPFPRRGPPLGSAMGNAPAQSRPATRHAASARRAPHL
jgi:alpha-D-xyloside xylohydrolase